QLDNYTPLVGAQVTYSLLIHNFGPDDGTNVVVAASLPAGLSFVSDNPSVGGYDASTGRWTLPALANGASATLAITATVNSPDAQTMVVKGAASDQAGPANSVSVTELPQTAALALTTTLDQTAPKVGDTIQYMLALTNNGLFGATDVAVTGVLPAGLVFV